MNRRFPAIALVVALLPACGGGTADQTGATSAPSDPAAITAPVGDSAPATTVVTDRGLTIAPWGERSITSLCIESDEVYTDWITVLENDQPTPLEIVIGAGAAPLSEALTEGLINWGIPLVGGGCDATLAVAIEGTVLSDVYIPGGRLYTGAEVQGTLSLRSADGASLSARFDDRKEPDDRFVIVQGEDIPDLPEEAPIIETIEDEVCAILQEWIVGPLDLQPAIDCWFDSSVLVFP